MVGFLRTDKRSNEAALKYLLLGAFSTGFLVYGFSVLYGMAGSTKLADIAAAIAQRARRGTRWCFWRMATTAVGLLFKISAAPFHMWAPDAYEGAPTTVTAYLSVASKAASFAFLLRIFLGPLAAAREAWEPLLAVVAVAHPDASATWPPSTRPTSSACWPTAPFRTPATCCSAWWPATRPASTASRST